MSTLASVALSGFVTLADGIDHAEGLTWDGERILCGGEAGQIYAVTPDGSVTQIACTDGFVLGLACDGQGSVYACDMKRREVLRFEPRSELLSTYSLGTAEEPMMTPNHPAFDSAEISTSPTPAIGRPAMARCFAFAPMARRRSGLAT